MIIFHFKKYWEKYFTTANMVNMKIRSKLFTIKLDLKYAFLLQCCLFVTIFFSGCAFYNLDQDLTQYKASFDLNGKIEGKTTGPIVVILYQKNADKIVVSQYLITHSGKPYTFIVKEGVYYILAFEDLNNNLTYDSFESFGYFGQPNEIEVFSEKMKRKGSRSINMLNIRLNQTTNYPPEMTRTLNPDIYVPRTYVDVGTILNLDDEKFILDNGKIGLWQPFLFFKDIGEGIYFLDPYNPKKIPILFVHGAGGTPVSWKPIIAKLDRQRYQPWFFYYPSGFRLSALSNALNRFITELHNKYKFKGLYIVAHSMGGLISRNFILKNIYNNNQNYISKFISISTPWNGIKSAKIGVKMATTVIPNWHDLSPDSKFIKKIYNKQLPIEFHLLFGVKGTYNPLMENNDGVVELSSALDYRAQTDAFSCYGFNENHGSILSSPLLITHLLKVISNSNTNITN